MVRTRDVHVTADASRGWAVTRSGRTLSRHRTQRRAIDAGRRAARLRRADLVIHGRDGRIRSKDSYGNEGPAGDTEHSRPEFS
jgi:hypothetical protein